jgi:DNA-directed RNA polymerase delta subunit
MLRLRRFGKPVEGKDPYRTLYRSLKKDSRFISISGRWSLRDWFAVSDEPALLTAGQLAAARDEENEDEPK